MPVAVVMPKLGLTMQEGTISRWVVASASPVTAGCALVNISTDKIETEIEAAADGVLHHAVPEGATVACGDVIAWLCAPDEAPPELTLASQAAVAADVRPSAPATGASDALPGGRLLASPNARRRAGELGIDLRDLVGTGPGGRIVAEDVEDFDGEGVAGSVAIPGAHALVSPVARRLAERLDLDPARIAGSGPGGRVTLDDVIAAGGAAPARRSARSDVPPIEVVPMTGKRRVIAERMHASLAEMAQLTLTMDATVDRPVKLRKALRDEWGTDAPGYTEFVLAALTRALREHPRANATIRDDAVHVLASMHLGLAIAVDDGLVVPVVRDADELSLAELTAETRRLATAARAGSLALADLEGATFSVTSLGAQGVDAFTPIINPPNVAILGIGRIRDGVRWKTKKKARRCRVLTLSLTIDHRALDGAPAAEFLATVCRFLESPHRLLTGI